MEKMKSDAPLDYAVFQLSPKRSRCELLVSSGGSTEKLASGFVKPFVAHLKVAEEQVASSAQSIKLELGRCKSAEWFTKGTLDRFVRFVSTPEILELVNTFDDEMSQLEAARRIYAQGSRDQLSGGSESGSTAADDATKKELLRAIDVRLVALQQDLTSACARAAAAGFTVDTISELQMFADRFGAHRLNEACGKFTSLSERRPNVINQWKSGLEYRAIRSSRGSDMSIDEDPPSPTPHIEPTMCQQPNLPPVTLSLRRTLSQVSSVERDDRRDETSATEKNGSIRASQPARRLSVQDRINLFENKQKEISGGPAVVVKPVELRRLSSDVSSMGAAAEKAVLRRWSGASDMSIDLSAEKKDTKSSLCAPSSATVSQDNKIANLNDDTSKNSLLVKPELKVFPSFSKHSSSRLKEGSDHSEQVLESSESSFNLIPGESDGLKDQGLTTKTQSGPFISSKADDQDNQGNLEEKLKNVSGGNIQNAVVFGDQRRLKDNQSGEDLSGTHSHIAGVKDQGSSLAQNRHSGSRGGVQVDILNPKGDSETRDKSVTQTSFKSVRKTGGESEVSDSVSGSRIREAFAAHYKEIGGDSSSAQQQLRYAGETGVVMEKESHASENGSLSGVEDSGPRRMRLNRQGSAAELSKNPKVQQDGNGRKPFSGRVTTDAQEDFDSFVTPPPEKFQRVRQSKGNQDLNDELKMKANELEKLFAEHQLRLPLPGDQSNSARTGRSESNSAHTFKLEDAQHEPVRSVKYPKPIPDISQQLSDSHKSNERIGISKNKNKLNVVSIKTIDSQNYGDTLNRSLSELSISEGSRGKLYHKYIQKRDAKLKDEWSSNRAEKEARLKSMQDSLERNRSEMKAKFSGSAERQDPGSSARQRAERLRSYNSRSIHVKVPFWQQHLEFEDSEHDDEAMDFLEKKCPGEDKTIDDISFGDGISKGAQGKKLLPNNRNLSSTRTSASTAVPRSAPKTSTNSAKRRMQPENPLAQSVPNFSELRKENTKPSSGGSKTTRSQMRNYARSKSSTEEVAIVKDDKSRRLQALRKSSANPNEFKEMSTLDSDGVVLTPMKFDEEILKISGSKPFLKKGSRAGFVARTNIARQRGSVGSEPVNNVDETDDITSEPDEYESTVKDREEECKTFNTEGHNPLEDGDPIIGLDTEKFGNSGSENGDGTLFSRVDQALGSQLTRDIPSSYLPVDTMQDSPSESPMSWNLRTQHPFSYPHESSDIDASVDSPVGSPSWNSHSFNQIEADAARMRKKWGTAQKPMLGAQSSNNISRKDMTRGFKRLLKFGRKSRGSETLVDWISATTSEGDDDTEDGRDLTNRFSEDLRKSRMGFSQAQPSDDESEQSSHSSIPAPPATFKLRDDQISGTSIKAPRSFFSLSTFRSKGSESKPR